MECSGEKVLQDKKYFSYKMEIVCHIFTVRYGHSQDGYWTKKAQITKYLL